MGLLRMPAQHREGRFMRLAVICRDLGPVIKKLPVADPLLGFVSGN